MLVIKSRCHNFYEKMVIDEYFRRKNLWKFMSTLELTICAQRWKDRIKFFILWWGEITVWYVLISKTTKYTESMFVVRFFIFKLCIIFIDFMHFINWALRRSKCVTFQMAKFSTIVSNNFLISYSYSENENKNLKTIHGFECNSFIQWQHNNVTFNVFDWKGK